MVEICKTWTISGSCGLASHHILNCAVTIELLEKSFPIVPTEQHSAVLYCTVGTVYWHSDICSANIHSTVEQGTILPRHSIE
jgi:hypothetical protein